MVVPNDCSVVAFSPIFSAADRYRNALNDRCALSVSVTANASSFFLCVPEQKNDKENIRRRINLRLNIFPRYVNLDNSKQVFNCES